MLQEIKSHLYQILKRFRKVIILLEGFWPPSNWKVSHVWFSFQTPQVLKDKEDLNIPPYYDPKKHEFFFEDINLHSF
jgi:hypothetical protein